MKLAIATSRGGGLETYALEAGLWLTTHGHSVHLIYPGRSAPALPERYAGLRVHSADTSMSVYYLSRLPVIRRVSAIIGHFARTRALAKTLHAIRAADGLDFVEISEGYAGAAGLGGLPFVMRLHGAEWAFRRYCEDGSYPRLLETLQRQMMMAARQRHSVSHAYATFIAGACRIPPRLIDVIRYPTDFAQFPPHPPPEQRAPFRLAIVGRLERRKGVHTLIEALPKVWAAQPDTILHLFGKDGDFGRAQIDAALPPAQQRGRLVFEGFVSRAALIEQLYRTHVYVGPTRFETSGLHLQEAMSAGRPVIGTRMGPLPEYIRHEENGWLVPLDDPETLAQTIVHALNHPQQRETLGRAARQLAQRMFDIDGIMEQQLALYRRDF